jgi:glycosyltransferase involved in cell wall biosynthesis
MNILVFSWRDPRHPTAGGAEQVMHEHMKGWIMAGHNVTLFSSRVRGLPSKEIIDKVKIIRRGIQYFGVQIEGFFYYIKNRENFDFVVDQFHGLPFFTPLYIRKPKLAVIQEVAKEVWLKNEFPKPFNWIVGIIGYIGEPLLFLFYKNTIFMTGSNSAKVSLIKVGISSDNINVINHGVIISKPKPMPAKEKNKTVMFLGAISKDKGIYDVLKTFDFLNKEGKYNFWLAGRASEFYKKLIKQKKVTYFGFVDEKKKFELLARAHVLINPSLLEGWGLVNIEANSIGTPVIAYNAPGLVDSVKDGVSGIIIKDNNPKELAKNVDELLSNQDKYAKLQKGAKEWSKKFSWENSRKLSLALIEEIVLK